MDSPSFFFMKPLLNWVERGGVIRNTFVWFLRSLAVIFGFGGVVVFVRNWGFLGDLGFFGMIGLLIAQVLLVVTLYMVVRVLMIRASDIGELNTGKYTVIPIFSIVSKLVGELMAIVSIMGGFMSGTIVLFVGAYGANRLLESGFGVPGVRSVVFSVGRSTLAASFSAVIAGFFFGFLALLVGYLWSEMIIVLVDIAENLTERDTADQR